MNLFKRTKTKDSELFALKSNKVFLNGNVGSGKTYFISKAIENLLKDEGVKTNFILMNMHADLGGLANELLNLGYEIYILNSYTETKFVKMCTGESMLRVSVCDINDSDVYKRLLTNEKTAMIVNGSPFSDTLYCKEVANKCISALINGDLSEEEIELVFVLDDFELMFNTSGEKEESLVNNEGAELITKLFDKYDDSSLEYLKVIISGQRINQISIVSELQNNTSAYQYINFSTILDLDGGKQYERRSQLENIALAIERSKVYEK